MDPKIPIRGIDYTVVFARQMSAMREFYGTTLGFELHREMGSKWIEYRVGSNILAGPTDQSWGHRTLFFRDPDGNVLEIYAEIETSAAK